MNAPPPDPCYPERHAAPVGPARQRAGRTRLAPPATPEGGDSWPKRSETRYPGPRSA
ncbi:hypothetical protein Ga0080574_TMP1821 [Salipiger abyssi]|uniref:Uncharacterized protein n=1 Tax=Salipiger abyssi TaxID=1250539 RepID=A0A1P8URY3_9RHOB|nr:hypothetical protein Ga0080574_TMP1821 [Salipiger abyssi]